MKSFANLITLAALSVALGGCVAVPYADGYRHDDRYRHDHEGGRDDRHY